MRLARFLVTHVAWDAATAVVLIGLSFVPGVAQQGLALAEASGRSLDPLGVVLIVVQGGAVALLGRWPQWSLAATFAAFSVYQLLGYPTTFAALGMLVALAGAGALVQRHRILTLTITLAAYVALVAALIARDADLTVLDAVVFGALLTALWMFGSWLRSQAALRRSRAEQVERETIAGERARIAHELHDVVTHHVTAIVVQAEAGQFRAGVDETTRGLLASIADGGRTTLVDLRSLLGALDGGADITRSPVEQQIRDIVARARSAGQRVELVEHGRRRPLAGAIGLVVVRVVQESLTNARKHARDGAASVEISYDDREILVDVVSSGRTSPASATGGRGIIGMRERVEFVGGELQAGPEGDRFAVHARIPA